MSRTRRVGTLTLGGCLVIFGILYLLRLFTSAISYGFLLNLWPMVLIFLGGEVIVSYIVNKEEKLKYDGAAVFLTMVLTIFALGMGCIEFMLEHYGETISFIR